MGVTKKREKVCLGNWLDEEKRRRRRRRNKSREWNVRWRVSIGFCPPSKSKLLKSGADKVGRRLLLRKKKENRREKPRNRKKSPCNKRRRGHNSLRSLFFFFFFFFFFVRLPPPPGPSSSLFASSSSLTPFSSSPPFVASAFLLRIKGHMWRAPNTTHPPQRKSAPKTFLFRFQKVKTFPKGKRLCKIKSTGNRVSAGTRNEPKKKTNENESVANYCFFVFHSKFL